MRFSKKIEHMGHSPIRKFHTYAVEAKEKGKRIYHLNIGQPDIETPPVFFEAVRQFSEPVLEYMPSQGIPSLLKEIRDYYRRIGVDIDEKDIIITDGGSEALQMAFTCICDEGDEIIAAEPFYTNYNGFLKSAGGKLRPVTTAVEEGFHFPSKEAIRAQIGPRTKGIIVTNPGNPTGVVLKEEEIDWLCELAVEYDLFLIADEVYREFVYDGLEMTSFGKRRDIRDRLIIIDSISKRFSACGSRVGALICQNEELISHAMKLAQSRLSVPTMDQEGAAALYRIDPGYFDHIKKEYQKRRAVCYEGLKAIEGVICQKPAGAFYITAKLPVDDAEDFLIWLLRDFEDRGETVMYAPASGFYETRGLGKQEIRIAYVLKEEDLRRAMEILKKAVEAYRAR